ncbi:unnamed protein product [Didymodactylos carnosus]|uniref:F-box domain-containing protein n=1 Tax=Didymodactylos carnosus TaxID=1234261 RepID=A0A8S2I7N6_9BILA|nr:unnamed protein product [Didymodactylos carnosus]CAF3727083.1 unnamed protein product [Didymodactylos carnosus]
MLKRIFKRGRGAVNRSLHSIASDQATSEKHLVTTAEYAVTAEPFVYDPVKGSFLLDLPPELFYLIGEHLSHDDLSRLSQTCSRLYQFINSDTLWTHLIRFKFPPSIAKLYTNGIFEEERDEATETEKTHQNKAQRPSFLNSKDSEWKLDAAAIRSAADYNETTVIHLTMHLDQKWFRENVRYYQFNKTHSLNCKNIPLMKLMYFYLIDRKRVATTDMVVVHLNNENYLREIRTKDSLNGRVVKLFSVCWLDITGKMENILPGKYEFSWRMRLDMSAEIDGTTEFLAVPEYGTLICYRWTDEIIQEMKIKHGTAWFTADMGTTTIYKPSTVYVAVRNWTTPYWKQGLSWDCCELKLLPLQSKEG